jgi:ribosome-binding factor A
MPREFKRSDRVADAILRSVSDVMRQDIRDPRIGMVNINEVQVTRDLSLARIYVSFIGVDSDEDIQTATKVLNDAAGYIRSHVAKDLKTMRSLPRLQFIFDQVSRTGDKLSRLIDQAVDSDRKKHQDD